MPVVCGYRAKKKKIRNLETQRTLYDNIALSLAVLPLLIWPLTLITAPMSLFMVFYFWRAPSSIIPRTKIRFIMAFLLSTTQIVGWVVFFAGLITD